MPPAKRDGSSAYQTPLYYDIAYDTLTAPEVEFVQAMVARHCAAERPRLLEPACGTGRVLRRLARAGFDVTGFDLSEPMLEYAKTDARRLGLDIDLSRQSLQRFEYAEPFDLAYCLVSTFKHLRTEHEARAHLRRVAECLRPGGVYVLGFHLTDYGDRRPDQERWTGRRDGVTVTYTIDSQPPNRRARFERMHAELVVRTEGDATPSVYRSDWKFRTYNVRQFDRLIRTVSDLELIAVHDFDYDPEPRDEPLGEERLDVVAVLRRS